MSKPTIAILGAGLAGLGAAWQLTRHGLAHACVFERSADVGGNAGSFELCGVAVDYGSHRLHSACDPHILDDIRTLLGEDLLTRPRHGRIRLAGQWIHFPLKTFDLLTNLPWGFRLHIAGDIMQKVIPIRSSNTPPSFASILECSLGRTICREFYFPYAEKIWGLPPEELSPIQAHRRVSANSLKKMLHKILAVVPGFKQPGSSIFFYPRKGFGQISNQLYDATRNAGVTFHLGARVTSLQMNGRVIDTISSCASDGQMLTYRPDYVWSTIPMPSLVQLIQPQAPSSVIEAAQNIQYRAMILIYLLLEQAQFSEYDAHYFPETDIPITRISEPKNYNDAQEPRNLTVLCAELPCSISDPEWKMTDTELGEQVCDCLKSASIPIRTSLKEVVTRRLSHAYPIYRKGYELYFDRIDHWLGQARNLLYFGRQGLFAHDNIHHSLYMAYAAVDCLNQEGQFNRDKWDAYRQVFNSHVVED